MTASLRNISPVAGLATAAASIAAVQFVLMRAGLATGTWPAALLLAGAVGVVTALAAQSITTSRSDVLMSAAVIAAGFGWIFLLMGASGVLWPGDGIAAPQFARALGQGRLLTQAYPPGSSAHAYPPGYPILLAPLMAALTPTQALVAFKVLSQAWIALAPAAWGWMHRRLFHPQSPAWLVTGAAYAAFYVLERNLPFLGAFAGKNAVIFAVLLAPGVFVATALLARRRWLWPLAAVPLFGLFLIHYSMVHLSAAFLGAYAAVELSSRRMSLAEAIRMALAGAAATALLLGLNAAALHDPRAVGVGFSGAAGLQMLAREVFALKPAVVVFHDARFGLVPSPFRHLQLAAAIAFAVTVGLHARRSDLVRSAGAYGLAMLVGLLFAFGLLPSGITLDFVRSYAWSLQAAVFMTAVLAAAVLWQAADDRRRLAMAAVAAPLVLALLAVTVRDGWVEGATSRRQTLPAADLERLDAVLPDGGPCFLIGESSVIPSAIVTVQRYGMWGYAEAVSPCRFLNGSWVQPGVPQGRGLDGLPPPAVLGALPRDTEVIFAGHPRTFAGYRARLEAQGLRWSWRTLDRPVGGAQVSVASPSSQPRPR